MRKPNGVEEPCEAKVLMELRAWGEGREEEGEGEREEKEEEGAETFLKDLSSPRPVHSCYSPRAPAPASVVKSSPPSERETEWKEETDA